MTGQSPPATRRPLPVGVKLLLELGPLAVFFLVNGRPGLVAPLLEPLLGPELMGGERGGIFAATSVFMVASILALALHQRLAGHLPVMPFVSGVLVVVFGGLTLLLQDELFIKLKPTIVNLLFGVTLLGGLALGRPLLALVLDSVLSLTEEGWRQLSLRWGLFFLFLALLNEIVWRTQTTDFWVSFKVFGVFPLTMVFALAQMRLIQKHEKRDARADEPVTPGD